MMKGAIAVLKQECPFFDIFPDGRAPVFPLGPERAMLEGAGEEIVYMLDVNRCEPEQVQEIAKLTAKFRGGTPEEVLDFLLTERRMPIRDSVIERVEGMVIPMRLVV